MSGSTIEERVIEQGSGREPAICELRCDNCGDKVPEYELDRCPCGNTACPLTVCEHCRRTIRRNAVLAES